jgi:hypothetical protein
VGKLGRGGAGLRAGGKRKEGRSQRLLAVRWRGKRTAGLGRVGRERERKAWLGWAARRKERGKKKRESGPGPIRKGARKRIAFKYI